MKNHCNAILFALLSCCFVTACKRGDGWEEYKYRDAGFAISAPLMPIPMRPSAEEPNARAYGIKYNNHSAVIITVGPLDMWENLPDKEKLQHMMDLTAQGTSSKLVAQKEISLDGNPGMEFEIEGSAEHWRTRCYMVNGKLLALQSFAPPGEPFVADTDRIFDSLRLLR